MHDMLKKYKALYDALPACYVAGCFYKATHTKREVFDLKFSCDKHCGAGGELPYAQALRAIEDREQTKKPAKKPGKKLKFIWTPARLQFMREVQKIGAGGMYCTESYAPRVWALEMGYIELCGRKQDRCLLTTAGAQALKEMEKQ